MHGNKQAMHDSCATTRLARWLSLAALAPDTRIDHYALSCELLLSAGGE